MDNYSKSLDLWFSLTRNQRKKIGVICEREDIILRYFYESMSISDFMTVTKNKKHIKTFRELRKPNLRILEAV